MLSRKQSQLYSSYCGSSEKVITPAFQASIASSNLVSRTKSHTFYPLKLVGQSMAWPLTCAMDDSPEIHEGLSASRMPCTLLSHAYMPVFTTWTHWWETTKPCQRQTKSGVYGCFFSPPFSCSASLCEQLLAGGSGENTGLFFFWVFCLNFWIYAVFSFFKPVDFDENMQPDLNICRITFYSTGGMLDTTQTRLNICRITFLKLRKLTKICALVWIYVVLPFTQTTMWLRSFPMSLNICRITFCSNWHYYGPSSQ